MRPLNRRSVLQGAVAVAGAAALGAARVPTTREEHRVVVIGSGFGGGVTALRLARAGVPVLVLERGRRWPTGPDAETFPHPTAPDKRIFWLAPRRRCRACRRCRRSSGTPGCWSR